jgi:dTDP-4-dehydrorhamnose 3,5-epimerase
LMLLHDGRADSPTAGLTQRVVLSPTGARQIRIPIGVWHLIAGIGTGETTFVNLPTEPYHHEHPDRILLPWDSEQIPVDVAHYLPKF